MLRTAGGRQRKIDIFHIYSRGIHSSACRGSGVPLSCGYGKQRARRGRDGSQAVTEGANIADTPLSVAVT